MTEQGSHTGADVEPRKERLVTHVAEEKLAAAIRGDDGSIPVPKGLEERILRALERQKAQQN